MQFLDDPKPDEPDSYEEQHSVIANAYLRGWFPLDAVSIAASLFDFLPFWLAAGDTKLKSLTVLRVVRILRLIKLLRLLKASRVLKSWAVKIPTPRATVTILSSLAECMFVSHMIACLLGLTAELAGSPLDTWLATHGYCTPQTDEDTGALLLDEDDERLFECVPPEYRYLQCFWWAWGMLMGAPISLSAPWGPYALLLQRLRALADSRAIGGTRAQDHDGLLLDVRHRALRAGLQQSRSRHARLPHGVGRAQPFRELQGLKQTARAAPLPSSARISRAQSRASSS